MSSTLFYNQDSVMRFKKRKARFTFSEVHILLDQVRKHRSVVVGKFNRGVGTDVKKRTWAEITARVNEIGECQREVIEVVKKWSDLKCDTKRKVGTVRSGKVPGRALNSRFSKDLTHTEKIVLQILEMDQEDGGSGDLGPLCDEDDDDDDDVEELDEDDMAGMQSSPNGADDLSVPASTSYTSAGFAQSGDSSQAAFDMQFEIPAPEDWDEERPEDAPPSSRGGQLGGNNGLPKEERAPASSGSLPLSGGAGDVRESVLRNASLSLHEQHATNVLLETVSRSLELLSESVQQLAETQQEFVRESLRLQRETVQVLRDFTGGAITLMHDKLNGRPAS
ncbi:uncharacterized protein LOC144212521 [Stigmatopora nigra]